MKWQCLLVTLGVAVAGAAQAANDWVNILAADPTGGLVANRLCYSTNGRDISCDAAAPLITTSGTIFIGTISATNGYFGNVSATHLYGDGSGITGITAANISGLTADRIVSDSSAVIVSGTGEISFRNNGVISSYVNAAGILVTPGISATTNQISITSLYASGKVGIGTSDPTANLEVSGTVSATRFVGDGSSLTGISTQGDRITSGTLVAVANSATGYISLTSGGTNWGYLSSGASYLPAMRTNSLSASTAIQVGSNSITCASGISGTMRYNAIFSTMEYCNGSAWQSLGPSTTVPYFLVNRTSDQTVTANNTTTLTWNNKAYDTNSNFSSNRFTPTVAGKYIIVASVDCGDPGAGGLCQVGINKNGSVVAANQGTPGGTYVGAQVTAIIDMNGSTDYLDAFVYSTVSTVRGIPSHTYFTGALLGAGGGSGGGATSPGGNDTNIQYNSGGAFAGSDNLAWVNATSTVSVTGTVSATYGYFKYISATNGGLGVSYLASLTDVSVSGSPMNGGILTYTGGKWQAVSPSQVLSTTTMLPGWPDALICNITNPNWGYATFYPKHMPYVSSGLYYYRTSDPNSSFDIIFNPDGSFNSYSGLTTTNCNTSISALYAAGQAFNFIGNNGSSTGTALGDRITSGTLVAVANSATGYISLTTGGTNWGYLSSGANYLPNLKTTTLSTTVISATAIQLVSQSTTPVSCNSGNSGSLRYNSPTTTLELCTGTGWQPMGVGIPAGSIVAFASTTCPTGWSEYTTARGRFLRGIDNGAGVDPSGTRTPGGTQEDDLKSHSHNIYYSNTGGLGGVWPALGNGSTGTGGYSVATGGNETRPKNVAVTFCQFNGTSNGWNNPLSGGSTATPAGSTGDVQYNSGGSLAADTGVFTYSSGLLKSTSISATNISGTTATLSSIGAGNITASGYTRASTISASTAIQVGSNSLTCASGISGTMRYSAISSTMEYCNGSAWTSMGPSATSLPAFSAYKSGSQTISANTWTKVTWDTIRFNVNNNFANDRFTPTIAGKYLVTVQLSCGYGSTACFAGLQKNGSIYIQNTGPVYQGAISTIVDMNGSTDYLEAWIYSSVTSVGSGSTEFTASLIASGNGLAGGGSTATPAGSTTEVQYNNAGSFGSSSNFTYSGGLLTLTGTITATNVYAGNISTTTLWVGGQQITGNASGDRIVSGSLLAVANSATGYVSLTTGGTNWGYLSSGNSYLPNLNTPLVSSTVGGVVSATYGYFKYISATSGLGGGSLATLTDVSASSPGTGMLLRYNGSKWESVGASTALSATTIISNWPDAIKCGGFLLVLVDQNGSAANTTFYRAYDQTYHYYVSFNTTTKAYAGTSGFAGTNCVDSAMSISQLYAAGQAFNFIGGQYGGSANQLIFHNGTEGVGDNNLQWISNTAVVSVTGTVSATNGYFKNISTTNLVVGGLTVTGGGSAGDRISTTNVASGATLGMVVADKGTISFTLAGTAGAAYLHGTLGLVAPGVSTTTGPVSATALYSRGNIVGGGNVTIPGEFISTAANQARYISGNYGLIQRNDGSNFYLLLTASGDQYGSWNTYRPFMINMASGTVTLGSGGTNVGINTTAPNAKLDVIGVVSATNFYGNYNDSASLPSFTWGGDPNTGLFSGGADVIGFTAGGTERARIIANGNFGINTTTPNAKLEVAGTLSATIISTTAIQLVSQSTTPVSCNSGNSGSLRYNSPTTTLELCTGTGWQPMGVGIPAGSIVAFASTTCPTGWSEYTTARGRFLRGIDNGAGVDPSGTRTPGGTQEDVYKAHTHSVAGTTYGTATGTANQSVIGGGTGSSGAFTTTLSAQADSGGNETRPKNVAVTFCQFNGTSNGWNNPLNNSSSDSIVSGTTSVSVTSASSGAIKFATNGSQRMVIDSAGNVGLGTTAIGYKLTTVAGADGWTASFQGLAGSNRVLMGTLSSVATIGASNDANNAWAQLNVYGSTVNVQNVSDVRLKRDIHDLPTGEGLAAIARLRPVTFRWQDTTQDKAEGEKIGLIAQEVQKIFPQFVMPAPGTTITKADGSKQHISTTLTLNYNGFIVPLIKSVQELKAENDDLRSELRALKAANDNLAQEMHELRQAVKAAH